MTDPLSTLTELLRELPGIGPRAARRLAFWFVRREHGWVESFARTLIEARKTVQSCALCTRLFPAREHSLLCSICANERRDTHTLLIVEKDVDLENIERTGAYRGRYFVLGGTAGPLDKEPERLIRIRELEKLLMSENVFTEVIFALSATTEGEDTALLLTERITPLLAPRGIVLTALGRGLSTGTELEYVDADTMKNALRGRV